MRPVQGEGISKAIERSKADSPGPSIRVVRHWRARAYEIAIAVDVVDPRNARPVFAVAQGTDREGRRFSTVWMSPIIGYDAEACVRRILQWIVILWPYPRLDSLHFGFDGD